MLIKFDSNFKDIKGSPNGVDIFEFQGGCVYNVPEKLAKSFIEDGKAREEVQLIENFTEIPELKRGKSLSEELSKDFKLNLEKFELEIKQNIDKKMDDIIKKFQSDSKDALIEFKQKSVKVIPNTNNLIWVDQPLSFIQKVRNKIAMGFYHISKIIEVKYG